MELDDRPDLPKYRILANWLRARVDDGTYAPGTPIPSEQRLMQESGYGRDTVRHAIAVLVEEGKAYKVHPLGTFAGPRPE